MYNVFSIVPCVEVSCKEFFFIQQHSKEQGQALVFDSHSNALDLCFNSECTVINFFSFHELINFDVPASS